MKKLLIGFFILTSFSSTVFANGIEIRSIDLIRSGGGPLNSSIVKNGDSYEVTTKSCSYRGKLTEEEQQRTKLILSDKTKRDISFIFENSGMNNRSLILASNMSVGKFFAASGSWRKIVIHAADKMTDTFSLKETIEISDPLVFINGENSNVLQDLESQIRTSVWFKELCN